MTEQDFKAKYLKLQVIAEGTYGIVYKAKNKFTQEICAIKNFKNVSKQGIPVSAIREINLLKNVKTPYILNPLDIYLSEDSITMITQWRDQPLSKRLKSTAFLSPKDTFKQILRAVLSLHSNYIIHRDLKPSNIVLNNGGDLDLRLIDFGMAKQDNWEQNPTWTNEVGTLYYRAPQLLVGSRNYNKQIDIWALGCIFYELLTKNILFKGSNQISQFQLILGIICQREECEEMLKEWGINMDVSGIQFTNWKTVEEKLPEGEDKGKCMDLLKKLLTINGKKRISCEEALEHAYFS